MQSVVAQRAAVLFVGLILVWAVSLYAFVDPNAFYLLALTPRRLDGLPGVIGMIFVHGSMWHLVTNTLSLIPLAAIVLVRGPRYYLATMAWIAVAGGLGVWLLGREAVHVGASGLVFGLVGFLIVRGLYERALGSLAVSLAVVLLYGGSVWGIVPQGGGISWEAHLFGLIAGGATARVFVAKGVGKDNDKDDDGDGDARGRTTRSSA